MQDELKASFEQSTDVIRQLNESNVKLRAEHDLLRAKIVGSVEQQGETVGERSNFKKNPTHTQYHGDAYQRERRVCPCTLIDQKRKRYNNAIDVVVHLHDPTDPSTKRTAPPCSAHVQLDDVP